MAGNAGNNALNGGAGDDRYLNLGGGQDTILDASGIFGAGIMAAQVTASMANGQVTLSVASGDSSAASAINSYAIEQFTRWR